MADSHSSRVPLSPAELVGNRIDENRLFEARFLFQKFTADIDPAVGEKLRKQLETRIARAEKTFAQGEQLEQAGELELAKKVYADLLGMVVDYPSLTEAQQRVEVAIKLGLLKPVEPQEDLEVPGPESSSPVIRPEASDLPASGSSFFQHRKSILLLVFSLLAALGTVSFWIFFRPRNEPVVVRTAVPMQSDVVRDEGPENRPAIRLIPEPTAAEPEIETVEVDVALPPSPAEDTSGKQPHSAAQEEPASGLIPDSSVSVPVAYVASTEGKEKTAVAPVPEPLPESVSAGNDEQVKADEAVREPEISSLSPLPDIPEVLSRDEETLEAVKGKGKQEAPAVASDRRISIESDEIFEIKKTPEPAVPVETKKMYTVQAGDTLETIAAMVYGNRYKWSQLVAANQEKLGSPPYVLLVGMQLRVPPPESATPENRAALLNNDDTYTIQSGDSLGSIARKLYGASSKWSTLYELNRDRLPTPGALQVGQQLLVKTNIPGREKIRPGKNE
ncbi:MAG: LysM peptidoglycan-binding domain-containing protein [Desulfobulbaceae bacterium]|nr:LysM peptidoglycan-binding domain-containing protein [Desulfobulbaceae bacterium]